ncbi:hypothetical protein J3459_009706 [Metarhizium acridum]|nr:hypothetical protein J3459_009706 [Metarhizium acridum]
MFPDEDEGAQKPCQVIETLNTIIRKCPRPRPFRHTVTIKSKFPRCCTPTNDISCGWAIVEPLEETEVGDAESPSYCLDSLPNAEPSGYIGHTAMEMAKSLFRAEERPGTSSSGERRSADTIVVESRTCKNSAEGEVIG